MTTAKKTAEPDTLRFHWTCPLCHWSGEVAVSTHFGHDHGRDLHVGERLLDCPIEPRHLYFLEIFACPGCATEDDPMHFVAEIHCIGNRWVAVQTFPARELLPAFERV